MCKVSQCSECCYAIHPFQNSLLKFLTCGGGKPGYEARVGQGGDITNVNSPYSGADPIIQSPLEITGDLTHTV